MKHASKRRNFPGLWVMTQASWQAAASPAAPQYVVGIDLGSQSCSFCVLRLDKSVVIKPTTKEGEQRINRVNYQLCVLDASKKSCAVVSYG